MDKLQQYLGGRDVMVISDHKPLEQFHKQSRLNSKRVDEWCIKYQDIISQITEVKYRKGCNHGDADGMSRPEIDGTTQTLNAITRSMMKGVSLQSPNLSNNKSQPTITDDKLVQSAMTFDFSLKRISEQQKHDPELAEIRKQLSQENMIDHTYVMENDVLYKMLQSAYASTKIKLIYIPSSMHIEVIRCYHDHPTGAHFGVNRTWLKLRKTCYWPNMKRTIQAYVKSCDKCARFNVRRTKPPGHLSPIEYPQGPLELISMDFWGPTSQYSTNGNKYVLVITDYYTKYVVATPLPNNTATTTAQCFVEQFIFKYGVPRRLITDQGVHFNNELMKNLTMLLGTNHIQTSAYHPQSNGLVERFNGTFHPQLAKLYNAELNNWDDYLAPVIYAYNTGVQNSTGYSPFQLMFGRNLVFPLDHTPTTFKFTRANDYWIQLMKCMGVYREAARRHIQFNQQQSKQRFDRNRQNSECEINDIVLWKVPGHRGKFEEQFSGPYIVISKQHPSYTIQDPNSSTIKQVHISHLKPVCQRQI